MLDTDVYNIKHVLSYMTQLFKKKMQKTNQLVTYYIDIYRL